jgi:hypothetical protein
LEAFGLAVALDVPPVAEPPEACASLLELPPPLMELATEPLLALLSLVDVTGPLLASMGPTVTPPLLALEPPLMTPLIEPLVAPELEPLTASCASTGVESSDKIAADVSSRFFMIPHQG